MSTAKPIKNPFEGEGYFAHELNLQEVLNKPDDDEEIGQDQLIDTEKVCAAYALSVARHRAEQPEYWKKKDFRAAVERAMLPKHRFNTPLAEWQALYKDTAVMLLKASSILLPFDQFATNVSHPYVVKGLMFKGHATIIFGLPGGGKSTLAAELALAVSYGEPIAGLRVKQCPVLYIAFERELDVQMRLSWLRKVKYPHRGDNPPIFMDKAKASMTTSDYKKMLARQRAASEVFCGAPIGFVIVDTLGLALGPDTEINNYDDINSLFRVVNPAIMHSEVAATFVHHSGKDPSRGELGSIAIRGGASVSIELRDGTLTWRKALGRKLPPKDYEIESFNIGLDEDGDEATVSGIKFVDHSEASKQTLSEDAQKLYDLMDPDVQYKGPDFYPDPFTRKAFRNAMKELTDKGLVTKVGEREASRYQRTDGVLKGLRTPPPHDGEKNE